MVSSSPSNPPNLTYYPYCTPTTNLLEQFLMTSNIYLFYHAFLSFLPVCGSQQTGKFLKRWEYQTTLPASCETCMQVRKQELESDMEQRTGSKLGKEYVKAVYCHPAYLTYMQSTSCKMSGWMKHKLESRLLGKISTKPQILR